MRNANFRNTKIKIAKSFIENNFDKEISFSYDGLSNKLWIRIKEIESFSEELFVIKNKSYKIKDEFYGKIQDWREKQEKAKREIADSISEYNTIWDKFQENYRWEPYSGELKPLIEKLHWYYLPVYEDYMIDNRGVEPEEDFFKYYEHYHALQDLHSLQEKPDDYWKTLKGDLNLDQSCKFPIYTNRFNREDRYTVKRLYNGWDVKFSSIGGFTTPDGRGMEEGSKGGFLANFHQDLVNYPNTFHDVIGGLWDLADSTEMQIEELQAKLFEVAKFVSETEKVVGKFYPKW